MEIDINNLTNFKIDSRFFKKTVEEILKKEGKKEYGVSIVFVNKKEIKKINKKYRKKDKVTDVLSFAYLESNVFKNEQLLGEVVICPHQAKKEKKEITKVLIHGILHLLGYDHEKSEREAKAMKEKEKEYASGK